MYSSLKPCLWSRSRRCLFSSATLLAAAWTSDDASIPWSSHVRRRCSSSWTYSRLRARDLLWLSRMRARLAFCYAGGPEEERRGPCWSKEN